MTLKIKVHGGVKRGEFCLLAALWIFGVNAWRHHFSASAAAAAAAPAAAADA